MLPAFMHPAIAKQCVMLKKHLVTASYVSEEMKALDEEAKKAGVRGFVAKDRAGETLLTAADALLRGQTFFPG